MKQNDSSSKVKLYRVAFKERVGVLGEEGASVDLLRAHRQDRCTTPSFKECNSVLEKYTGLFSKVIGLWSKKPNDGEIKYAGFGMRMLASAIDSILSFIVLIPVLTIFHNTLGNAELQNLLASGALRPEDLSQEQVAEFIIGQLASFTLQNIVLAIVVILFWIYRSATPGKILLKMKIVDAKTGEKPSRKQLIIRYIGYIISILPLGLGFIWIYYDKKCQGWHDKMAHTVVVFNE